MQEKPSPWNSLEIAKLLVALLLPMSIALFGFVTSNALQKSQKAISESLQDRQSAIRLSEALVEKRKEIYDNIRIPLNNIYCYIEELGNYKKMTPDTVIADRRELHSLMHTQRAYWSPDTFSLYLRYMDEVAFETWNGPNKDALIQDNPGNKEGIDTWKPEWQERFTGHQNAEHQAAYDNLLNALARDIGANIGR